MLQVGPPGEEELMGGGGQFQGKYAARGSKRKKRNAGFSGGTGTTGGDEQGALASLAKAAASAASAAGGYGGGGGDVGWDASTLAASGVQTAPTVTDWSGGDILAPAGESLQTAPMVTDWSSGEQPDILAPADAGPGQSVAQSTGAVKENILAPSFDEDPEIRRLEQMAKDREDGKVKGSIFQWPAAVRQTNMEEAAQLRAQANARRSLLLQQSYRQATAEGRLGVAELSAEARKYAADRSLEGRRYGADASLEGRLGAADAGLEGRRYAADTGLEGRKYAADRGLEGRKYASDASSSSSRYRTDNPGQTSPPATYHDDQAELANIREQLKHETDEARRAALLRQLEEVRRGQAERRKKRGQTGGQTGGAPKMADPLGIR